MRSTLVYETIPVLRLSPAQVASWNTLLETNGALRSAFFRPEYTQAVAAVRESIEVCIVREGDLTVGFFPFERIEPLVGRPVGGSMSNFQGVIAAPDTQWSAEEIARSARLELLKFHHQIPEQTQFTQYTQRTAASPIVDLSRGWDAYLEARRQAGVSSFNALPRKMRKLERELGTLNFVPHSTESDVFEQLVTWKLMQYERTNSRGSLSNDWSLDVLRRLMRIQDAGFAGTLSALYAGDRMIAAHAGMRSATAWHYWFPAYDPAVGQLSPGLVLMHEMCRWAAGAGLDRIDLGPGEGAHKDLFATSETSVGVGQIVIPRPASLLSRLMKW